MVHAAKLMTDDADLAEERRLRIELAAAFRLVAEHDWHESVGNHLSVAISPDGRQFLMNPKWTHFSMIRASDLLRLDSYDEKAMERPDAPEPTAWCIHSAIHTLVPHARCVMHLHPPYATALAALADPNLKPIDQNTARYYGRAAIDLSYGGIADVKEEGQRLAGLLGERSVAILGNHGVLVTAASVAEAFSELYYLERACQTLVLAYQTGQPLNVMPHELAEKTARGWEQYDTPGLFRAFFGELMRRLDRTDPTYAK